MMKPHDKQSPSPTVRPATQAGRFYERDAQRLSKEVDSLLALYPSPLTDHPSPLTPHPSPLTTHQTVAALIVPHAGYYFSGNVAAAAYMTLLPDSRYKRVFLLGPSHHEWLDGASVNCEADYYATPLGQVKVDRETAMKLTADSIFTYRKEAHDREHCLEVQLPFLQRFFALHSSLPEKEVPPIVPIIISTNDYSKLKRMAEVLQPYFNDENLFIVSSDFSHYPSYDNACKVDALTREAVESGDAVRFIATIERNAKSGVSNLETSACGAYPIITLMLMLDSQCQVKHLLYQNSGDADDHDPNRVVGYHAFAILRNGQSGTDTEFTLTDDDKKLLKEIAFQSISEGCSSSVECRVDSVEFATALESVECRVDSVEFATALESVECRVDSVEFATAHDASANGRAVANSKLYTLNSTLRDSSLYTLNSTLRDSSLYTLNSTLKRNCGVFVSLYKHGQLRGCIGHFGEDVPLYRLVADMARSAAFEDGRFPPLRREELGDIRMEISVLTPMRRIYSLDEFQMHRHGIFIRKGNRSGTLLPQVADELNCTKEEFIGICSSEKARLGWNGWHDAELYVYEAIVF